MKKLLCLTIAALTVVACKKETKDYASKSEQEGKHQGSS